MKLLFAANRFPYPPYRGDKLKIYHLAKRLAKRHELHLLTFLEDENDKQYLPELEKIFTKIHLVKHPTWKKGINTIQAFFTNKPLQVGYFQSRNMQQIITEIITQEKFDVVHVQHLRLAQYWYKKSLPRILDLPDAYSLYWKRRAEMAKGWKKAFNTMEYKRVKKYEAILNEFEMSLVCSREDLSYLKEEQNITNVNLLPNGVDCSKFYFPENKYQENKTILFTGNMDYEPNVDAVIYFSNEIFPIIQQQIPNIKFIIAGQRPVEKVLALANESIEVTGFIEDLSAIYRKAAIVVAPLRFGAGTQNKVLEAMATGIPVVSHNIGFNGLNIISGEGVFLAKDKKDFATYCIQLLQDSSLRKAVGQKGYNAVKNQFDWDAIALQLENYFKETIEKNIANV